jgi:creatinine amidohydrolase
MDRINAKAGMNSQRLPHLSDVFTAINWYADYPNHQAGDPSLATKEKGERLLALMAEKTAALIKAVKDDNMAGALREEFFDRAEKPL